MTTQTITTYDDPLAWLDEFDSGLLDLERVTRSNFIAADDRRPRCDAWTGEPEFGRLCGNLVKNGGQYCGTHVKKRQAIK